jgi:hypothetical protein
MRRTVYQLQAHAMRRRSLAVDRLIRSKGDPFQVDRLRAWVHAWNKVLLRLSYRAVITS